MDAAPEAESTPFLICDREVQPTVDYNTLSLRPNTRATWAW